MSSLRNLPSVEQLLQSDTAAEWIALYGRPLTLSAIRAALDQVRSQILSGSNSIVPDGETLLAQAASLLQEWLTPSLLPVINATGVILHTNLGRAPLSQAAIAAMEAVSRGYSTLEFDLHTGKRGSRLIHAEALLQRLTGAEAAVVVNNNAAAVLLVLSALASRRRAVIARSQLVEIGGGFRVPEVMKQSRATLIEIGTTNKVHLADYEEALAKGAAVVVHVHRSNFKMIGFTEEPTLQEIVQTAHRFSVPVIADLGSGVLLDTARYGLGHEPTVQEVLATGADLVCFSGDKLLGGPQAGIVIGQKNLIEKIKKHPLARAMRADKTRLAGLAATLIHYLKDEAESAIPVWQMIAAPASQLKARAARWAAVLQTGEVIPGKSTVGGGSLPEETLETWLLALEVRSPNRFMDTLRHSQPPIIARADEGRVVLDPRTVLPDQEEALLAALQRALR